MGKRSSPTCGSGSPGRFRRRSSRSSAHRRFDGVGRVGGWKLIVEDRGDNSLKTLQGQTDNLVDKARKNPKLTSLAATFRANVPQFFVDVNRSRR